VEPTELLPIIAVLSIITVEFGGFALLGFLTGRGRLDDDERKHGFKFRFFRAGHAHAGVLIVLSLVYFIYLERTDYSSTMQWIAGLLIVAGTLAQSGGFFVHMGVGEENRRSPGTALTILGAIVIAVALVVLAIGLISAL
jgi:heme/copper-type cytochrome/quinol oxidase subunit 4